MSFQSGSGGTSKKLRPKFAALQTPYPDQKPFFSKALCSMKGLGKLGVRCLVGGGTVASVVLVALALLAGCAAVTFACWHYCERGYTACRHDHNGSRNLLSRSVFPGIGTARTCLISCPFLELPRRTGRCERVGSACMVFPLEPQRVERPIAPKSSSSCSWAVQSS